MKTITVYCASSVSLADEYHVVARELGAEIARRGIDMIYGGGAVGLMGETSTAARDAGGKVIGIITEHLVSRELADDRCHELVVVETMRERKKLLVERGEGFVVLPGGIGTYEELFETLVARKLAEHDKPIGLVNCHDYFTPLIKMIHHGVEQGFIGAEFEELVFVHEDPIAVLDHVADAAMAV